MDFTFLYVTAKDNREARRISTHLLQLKLIACANYFPIESSYWWKRKIVKGKESVLILKTMKSKVARIRKEIEKLHSYRIAYYCKSCNKKIGRALILTTLALTVLHNY